MKKQGWFRNLFSRTLAVKESEARAMIALQMLGRPVSTPANYKGFSEEGYRKNVIAFRSIQLLAKACGGIPWLVYQRSSDRIPKHIDDPIHPLVKLMTRPNPIQSKSAFIEAVVAYYGIAGNSYIEATTPGSGPPMELWTIQPDLIKVIPGRTGVPSGYEFNTGSNKVTYQVDAVSGQSPILQLKTFNPTNIWYGMSPIEAAAMAVDQHNESSRWNLSLLQNKATPSGALVVTMNDKNPSGALGEDQYTRIKMQMDEQFMGAKNAGRPLLLEGGMDWKSMSFSPADMDWIEGKHTSARDISLALGVPPILLNIPGDSTFSNFKEARLSFYEDTVLPTMDLIKGELNNWLVPAFGDDLYLEYDRDSIEALAPKREAAWARIQTADWLTVNEKREATGYEEFEGGDEIMVPMSSTPLSAILDANDEGDDDTDEHPTGDPEEDPTEAEEGEDEGAEPTEDPNDDPNAEDESGDEAEKSFNVNTPKRKQRFIKSLLVQRETIEKRFENQLKAAFKKEGRTVSDAVKGIHDLHRAEIAVRHALDKTRHIMKEVLRVNLTNIMTHFGEQVLNDLKFIDNVELKAKNTKFQSHVKQWVDNNLEPELTDIYGTTLKRVQRGIKDAVQESYDNGDTVTDLSDAVQKVYDKFDDSRAMTIARTETTIASNQGSLGAAKSIDVPLLKFWVAVGDERTRSDHEEAGNSPGIGLDEKFKVGSDDMDGPGDPSADASEIVNCRCALTYERVK